MRRFHRPAILDPSQLEGLSSGSDPFEAAEAAHRTAAVLVARSRAADDPELTGRLIGLVHEVGLSTLAQMWADRPARTLPGALWRLYLLHEWVERRPDEVGRALMAGSVHAEVYRVIAGVAEPPQPTDLRAMTTQILTGVYTADLATALDRAAAFCHVTAAGLADLAENTDAVQRGARLQDTARDLQACASLWRLGSLD